MNHTIPALAAGLLIGATAHADFGVSLITTTSDTADTGAVRCYNQGAPGGPGVDPSEKGDLVWLVFDVDGGGVFRPGALSGITYDGSVADLMAQMIQPGDYILQTSIPGPVEGRLFKTLTGLPETLQSGGSGANLAGGTVKPAVVILFDVADLSNAGRFGFAEAAVGSLIPQVGNVSLRVAQDVYADSHTFTVGGSILPPVLSAPTATNTETGVVLSFSFTAAVGVTYTLLSTTNLADQPVSWTPESSPVTGAGASLNLSATNTLATPQKFYQVRGSMP